MAAVAVAPPQGAAVAEEALSLAVVAAAAQGQDQAVAAVVGRQVLPKRAEMEVQRLRLQQVQVEVLMRGAVVVHLQVPVWGQGVRVAPAQALKETPRVVSEAEGDQLLGEVMEVPGEMMGSFLAKTGSVVVAGDLSP